MTGTAPPAASSSAAACARSGDLLGSRRAARVVVFHQFLLSDVPDGGTTRELPPRRGWVWTRRLWASTVDVVVGRASRIQTERCGERIRMPL
ncbi:MAG TPA: hypothetical protein VN894_01895, partial [Polyangiaceae bacterium]|nr:hypothetical protein [Polyangiaceae bacterium]